MVNSDQLRKKRGALRTGVTRALTQLPDLLQQTDLDLSEVSVQLDYLKDRESALPRLADALLAVTDEDNLDSKVETAQVYRDKISYALACAKYWLQERHQATRTHAQASGSGSSNLELLNSVDALDQVREQRQRSVILPRLQIPTFDGNLGEWQAFWDHYDATIHQNNELPRIEKFKYLLTYLTGSAKWSIEGIWLAEQNYELAIKTLTGRFGGRDLLINEYVDQLLALILVKSSSDVAKLRTLHDNVQSRVSALEGLGVSPDQYIVVVNRVMMRCLPDDLAIMYRQKIKEDDGATSGTETPEDRMRRARDLLTFLRIQVEVMEEGRLQLCRRPYESENMSMATESTGGAEHIPSAAALTSSTVSVNQVRTLCKSSGHTIISGNAILSADDKR
ncbi:uncharacterized protein LOC119378052, partial [Rhipicephalus sanguineus]|uniref:uncharacterized protein LOC119378052 n=1 Tax=Rhipicephalus sanguineus TaxID=34632 RepID=UPI001892E925